MVAAGAVLGTVTSPVQTAVRPLLSLMRAVHRQVPDRMPGPLTGSPAPCPGSTVSMESRNECVAEPSEHAIVPVPLVNRWPAFRTPTVSRACPSTQPAATPMICVLMRSALSSPTVTATPMITRETMSTRVEVCPLDRGWACCGGTSGVAVMPARYWAGRAPAGTVTRNRTPCGCAAAA